MVYKCIDCGKNKKYLISSPFGKICKKCAELRVVNINDFLNVRPYKL